MHNYYYRLEQAGGTQEIIIQLTHNTKCPLSIRVTEEESETAMVNLPIEEIDHMIAALQSIKASHRVTG